MTTACTTVTDLSSIIEKARQAQRLWSDISLRERLRFVRRVRHLLVARVDQFAEVIAREVGKTPIEVLGGEVLGTADASRFLESQAASILRPRRVPGRLRPLWLMGLSDVVHRRPRGIVGIIGTWNYPLFLNGVQILQALVAGNAVVWKPSEVTPNFAVLWIQLLREAGFPAELVQGLPATREMGPALAEADIDHVVFTGSAQVGRRLASRLGERLISSTLELSGCDAQFVLEDADLSLAVRGAWFALLLNRGQTCIAVRRIFVHRSIYDQFCAQLTALNVQARPQTLTLSQQVREANALIDDALQRGARLLVPRQAPTDDSLAPTILADANPDMAICRQAAFAPILAVLPYSTLDDALSMEEKCPYALGASVFTRDLTRAQQLAARLRAGAVTINDVIVPTSHPATPFGGRGASGWGVTQGAEGLLEMTIPQVVSHRAGSFRPHYDMDDPRKLQQQGALLRGFLEASHHPSFRGRIAGWWHMLRALIRGT